GAARGGGGGVGGERGKRVEPRYARHGRGVLGEPAGEQGDVGGARIVFHADGVAHARRSTPPTRGSPSDGIGARPFPTAINGPSDPFMRVSLTACPAPPAAGTMRPPPPRASVTPEYTRPPPPAPRPRTR